MRFTKPWVGVTPVLCSDLLLPRVQIVFRGSSKQKTLSRAYAFMFSFSGHQRALDCPFKVCQSKGFEYD